MELENALGTRYHPIDKHKTRVTKRHKRSLFHFHLRRLKGRMAETLLTHDTEELLFSLEKNFILLVKGVKEPFG